MAEEIRLIGSFQDNITPKLQRLNREIKAVTNSFSRMQKKLKPVARDMGRIAAASERTARALRAQREGLDAATRGYSAYTRAVGKAVSANRRFKPVVPTAPKPPAAPAPPMGGMPGGQGGLVIGGLAAGGTTFGMMAGQQMMQLVNQGLRMGFDYGKDIIMGAFQKFGNMIAERVDDELSDIQSAGGMFALDKKQDPSNRLFANFAQARNMQEMLNRELARSAAALPGATSDYVQSAKQLTDTVFGTFARDKEAFAQLAVTLGGKEGATDAENITTVLTRFTEQSVLLSQGSKGGMPLGMLLEQLITMENVNIDAYKKKYKQLRSNPLLANMLKDAEADINNAAAGSAERFRAVMKALESALPEEVVNSMRRSVSGVTESLRSAFLDPEVGLIGLGRPLKSTVASINSFGQYIDENGKVVRSAAEAAKEQTTVFKLIRDILAGFGGALAEIAVILPQVFDPLEPLANALMEMRTQAVEFAQMFTGMTNYIKAKGLDDAGARGGIAAFSKMLQNIGAIDADMHKMNVDAVMSKDADFATVVPRIMDQLLKSEFAEKLGKAVGEVMGTIIATIGNLMAGVSNDLMDSGLAKGFMDGWNAAGGSEGIKNIFKTIFGVMKDLLLLAIKEAPMEMLTIALIGLAPALAAGLMAALPSLLPVILPAIGTAITNMLVNLVIMLASGTAGALIATVGAIIVAAIGASLFYEPIMGFLNWAQSSLLAIAPEWLHGLINGFANIFKGVVNVLAGLGDILIGIFTLNWGKIVDGIVKIFGGLAQLVMGSFGILKGAWDALVGGIKAFFNMLNPFKGGGEGVQSPNTQGNQGGSRARSGRNASSSYDGNTSRTMPLMQAIATEEKNKPAGSHLVIANSSETVIPAFKGYTPDQKLALPAFDGLVPNVNVNVDTPATPAVPAFDGHINVATPAVPAFDGNINVDTPAVPAFNGLINVDTPAVPAFDGHINVATPAVPAFNGHINVAAPAVPAFTGYKTETAAEPAFKGYMAEPAFEGSMTQPTYGGMGESNTTINFNPTINTGNNMDPDELANLMAEKVMEAVQEATYAEVYTS